MSTPAIAVTESASAPEPVVTQEVETPEISIQERLDKASAADLKTWREKGDIPAIRIEAQPPTKKEEPAPSTEISAEPVVEAKPVSETVAAPEAAKPQKKDAATRLKEVLAERKKDRDLIRELTQKLTAPAPSVQPASQPVTEKPKTEVKPALRAMPKLGDTNSDGSAKYQGLDDFTADLGKWTDEKIEAHTAQVFEQSRTAQEKKAKEFQFAENQKELNRKWTERVNKAREKYIDFDDIALNPRLPIQQGSMVDAAFLNRESGPELLYYFGQHPQELTEMQKLNPMDQVIAIRDLELKLTAAPAPQPDPVAASPARREPPKLPAPPTELSARRSAPVDDADAALAKGDTAGYIRAMNARDLARSRKG